jgi:hypothetical protein
MKFKISCGLNLSLGYHHALNCLNFFVYKLWSFSAKMHKTIGVWLQIFVTGILHQFLPLIVYILHTISSLELKAFEFHISSYCYLRCFPCTAFNIDRIYAAIYKVLNVLHTRTHIVGHDGHDYDRLRSTTMTAWLLPLLPVLPVYFYTSITKLVLMRNVRNSEWFEPFVQSQMLRTSKQMREVIRQLMIFNNYLLSSLEYWNKR